MTALLQDRQLIASSGLFDADWYLARYQDVAELNMDPIEHFLHFGARLLRSPSARFDTKFYLEAYPDVVVAGINPLLHFIVHGAREGRAALRADMQPRIIRRRAYSNFSTFLAASLVSPVVQAPFVEEDKRVFAMMERIGDMLAKGGCSLAHAPKISVIMPVLNREHVVGAAIASVLSQSYPHFELIVVDDGSTDETLTVVKAIADPRIVVIENRTNLGVSASRNIALRAAQGEYIAYLDSDNSWDERYLAAMAGAFARLPRTDALYCGQYLFRGAAKAPEAIRFASFNRSLLANRNYIDLNVFCHTKNVYRKVGGFDESLRRYVDWDLIMRIAECSTIASVPALLSHYFYDNAENTITKNAALAIDLTRVREKQALRRQVAVRTPEEKQLAANQVSVIVPSFQALDELQECLESVFASEGAASIEVIVVDNRSDAAVVRYLEALATAGKIRLILNERNYGFTYAVNQGIAAAMPGNDILLLNNDARLAPSAIGMLQTHAYRLRDCAIAVPLQVLPAATESMNEHVPFADPAFECDVNISAHHANAINMPVFHKGDVVELDFAPFFCAYLVRERIGEDILLDAEFGRHYRSDRSFCDYVRNLKGGRLYQVATAVVHHQLQRSTRVLREDEERSEEFKLIFSENKWSDEELVLTGFRRPLWDM